MVVINPNLSVKELRYTLGRLATISIQLGMLQAAEEICGIYLPDLREHANRLQGIAVEIDERIRQKELDEEV